MQGKKYINKLKFRWIITLIVQGLAIAIGLSFFVGALFGYFFYESYWVYAIAFLLWLTVFLLFKPFWKINDLQVARYLDRNFPALEESSTLLLKDEHSLNLLEKLQLSKISKNLPERNYLKNTSRSLLIGLIFLGVGVASTFALRSSVKNKSDVLKLEEVVTPATRLSENVLRQVAKFSITISPPSYTSKAARTQQQFYIKAETGAKIHWSFTTNKAIKSFYVIFNDSEKIKLNPLDKHYTQWNLTKKIDKQGFYQLELDGIKSDLYQIDVIPDLPVSFKIAKPKPQTTIDIGALHRIDLEALLVDDYGIVEAHISATMASGKGESVSFTERKLSFNTKFSNRKSISLRKAIDLKSLGMKPGDEMYFFISAKDNKGQQSRSDVYTIAIVDTTELMSMAGMTSGVNLVPEYFRSQRQIILDTEKLLVEKAKISEEEFKKRSNNLGVDQKLLRLRYGQFLGEENETQIGGDEEHHDNDGHDHSNYKKEEEKFGDVQSIMDKYAHKHDIAEDATFFEPEIKAQLKAVLNEMWKAELSLRTYKPQEALPFEYKALRLLKDLQQKSRAYVAKTTIKTTALKLEKRLTGELDKITEPVQNLTMEITDRSKEELKVLLSLLSLHKHGQPFSANEKALLQTGEKQIIAAAANYPSVYLEALKSLRRLNSERKPLGKDLKEVAKAIYKIIGVSEPKPLAKPTEVSKKLSDNYFYNLKKY
ncbi:MAG: hypothetical protein EOO96_02015 [Pedobacter sp.]|nr:MAG: hypothetical protein EOO96_02015 [Pedobacter sp.]